MKHTKKYISVFLAAVMAVALFSVLGVVSFAADADVLASGECGDQGGNLTWTLTNDRTLTVSGVGDMAVYYPDAAAPWDEALRDLQTAYLTQLLADRGFASMEDAEAALDAGDAAAYQLQLDFMTYIYRNHYDSFITKLVIEEGVAGVTNSFGNHTIDEIVIPSTLERAEHSALYPHTTLTVYGAPAALDYVRVPCCDENFAFEDQETYREYCALENAIAALNYASRCYFYTITDADVQAYLADHPEVSEDRAREILRMNLATNGIMIGVQFGYFGPCTEAVLDLALTDINQILGTAYWPDSDWAHADFLTDQSWYIELAALARAKYFGSSDTYNVNIYGDTFGMVTEDHSHQIVPWFTVQATNGSGVLARMQDSGANYSEVFPMENGEYNWVAIPTSPEGLSAGDYYLDWSYDELSWSPAGRQEHYEIYASGSWYVDLSKHVVKGLVTVPAAVSPTGRAYTQAIGPSSDLFFFALTRVADFAELPRSADGLAPGDFYIDAPAYFAAFWDGAAQETMDQVRWFMDADSLDFYAVIPGYFRYYHVFDPALIAQFIHEVEAAPDAQPDPPAASDPSDPSGPSSGFAGFIARLQAFLQRILNFFRTLFRA